MDHMTAKHTTPLSILLEKLPVFTCDICDFSIHAQTNLVNHIASEHPPSPPPSVVFECELCPYQAKLSIQLKKHIASTHPELLCQICPFTTPSYFAMGLHMGENHQNSQQSTPNSCQNCCYSQTNTNESLVHMQNDHDIHSVPSANTNETLQPSNSTLKLILEEQIGMFEEMNKFKDLVTSQLSAMADFQQSLRDDIQHHLFSSTNLVSSFARLEEQQNQILQRIQSIPNDTRPSAASIPENTSATTPSPPALSRRLAPTSSPSVSPPITAPTRSNHILERAPRSSISRIPTSEREKVLFISDSIAHDVDRRHLEEATNTLIYSEKAFGAQFKSDALFPHLNFCDIAPHVACKRDYKYAVMQGASIDISNLDTSNPATNIAYFEQEVFVSSQNMITAAELLLQANTSIETVVIMERIPRFDPESLDPARIKPELSKYANKVLRDQLQTSCFKDKIVIGSHCLPTEPWMNIYGDPTKRGYDGVHLYGPDGGNFYTRSVCNVLQTIFSKRARASHFHKIPHNNPQPSLHKIPHYNPQPSLQGSQTSQLINARPATRFNSDSVVIDIEFEEDNNPLLYSVPTSNFFNVLGN